MTIASYDEALSYIFRHVNFEHKSNYKYTAATFDLARVYAVLEDLGNPHQRFRSVHIAGTKGKGSSAAFTESILRTAGYRTGLFTSPHLHTFRERIRLNGALLERDALVETVNRCREVLDNHPQLTVFETITALAFNFFAHAGVEWAVLEVGLGGRLDATNVVTPEAAAITSLSFDHTELLGSTLSLIAWEKAGIIKPGVPVISAPQATEALDVIRDVCQTIGAGLAVVGRDILVHPHGNRLSAQGMDFTDLRTQHYLKNLQIPLIGRHQLDNAACATALCLTLRAQGLLSFTETELRQGLTSTYWPGRCELLHGARYPVIVDSAHNRESMQHLLRTLRSHWPDHALICIFAASRDKDIAGMLDVLAPACELMILTHSHHPRAVDVATLVVHMEALGTGVRVLTAPDTAQALALADAEIGTPDTLVCVTGSIFTGADAREAWLERYPEAFAATDWVRYAEPLPLLQPLP